MYFIGERTLKSFTCAVAVMNSKALIEHTSKELEMKVRLVDVLCR